MTQEKAVPVVEMEACRACGASGRLELLQHMPIWLCSNRFFGGDCPSETAYLTEDAWNQLPDEQQADEGECELCGKPLRLGQFVNQYGDIGAAHANCEKPFAKPTEPTPAPADDGSTMPTYVLLGEPALLETISDEQQAAIIAELGWQPIETAPKDGRWFVTTNADASDGEYEAGRYDPVMGDIFVEAGDGLYRKERASFYDWRGFNNFHRATHWMPLPALAKVRP